MSSCTNYQNIDIQQVKLKKINLQSTSNAVVEMEVVVANPANTNIYLNSFDGFLTRNGVNFAQIRLLSSDTAKARTISAPVVAFQVELLDPLTLLSMGLNISTWELSDFNINARVQVRTSSGARKQLKFKNIPLKQFIDKF